MTVIDSLLLGQAWVVAIFAALALLLFIALPGRRSAVGAHIGIFIFSLSLIALAHILDTAGMKTPHEVMRATAVVIQGMVLISVGGMILFLLLLPMLGIVLPRIFHDVAVFVVQVVWLLLALDEQGVNLAGIIATSAVITAVIGLALQDTLGNIVSGLAIQLDSSVQVGDWVRIDDITGRVVETRWRFVAVETRNWETILMPNSVVSKAKVVVLGQRQNAPVQWRRWVWFNVDFRFSPSVVVETVETAIQAAEIPRVAKAPAPSCVAMEFAESYTRYAVRYWLTDIAVDDPTDSEVRIHIYSALKRAGMTLSIPAHAIFMTEETAERKAHKAQDDLKNRVAALRRVKLFECLTQDDLEKMAARLVFAPFDRGDVMTRQGAEAHWLYLVIDGTADRFVENEAHVSTKLATIGAGEIFGQWSIMLNRPRETTVVATSLVRCYRLPKDAFLEALGRHPELAEMIADIIAQQKTQLDAALQHLDEEARRKAHSENQSRVLEGLKRLFGV